VKVSAGAKAIRIHWPSGVGLQLALEGNRRVLGVRDVTCNGIALRNPRRLWRPVIRTAAGIHYHTFELDRVITRRDGCVTVRCHALGSPACLHEEQDEYLCDVFDAQRPDEVVRDVLEWRFAPCQRRIDGHEFAGFSYQFHFATRAAERAIYRLFDDATWEIGGRLAGNTLLFQGQCNPPVSRLSKSGYFTTACNYYGAEMKGAIGIPKRVSFQRLPRAATIQAFDMLVHRRGALLGMFEPDDDVLTLVQTASGEDVLHVIDERRAPLGRRFTTPPKQVLFCPAPRRWSDEAQRDLWHVVYDRVHSAIRDHYRVERSAVQPRVWIPQIASETFTLQGQTHPRHHVLDVLAKHVVPSWADMGVKEICLHSIWSSDYTADRDKRKDDVGGMHGALIVGSICNMRQHVVDPLWGGTQALKGFVDAAHARGMQVQLWWASHMSRRAPILAQRPDFMLTARDGLPSGGGFGHQSIITLDLNNPDCFAYLRDALIKLHQQTGFDGLFHDSYGNMTFLPMNFADPLRRGQQQAYGRLVHELQQAGIKTFTAEGIGALAVGHFGMNLVENNIKRGNYQYALEWWLGNEDMAYGLNMGIGPRVWPEQAELARELSFKFIAYGGRFGFTAEQDGVEHWSGWLREHNQILGRILPLWGRRMILPRRRGVLWNLDRGGSVLFAFQALEHALPAGAKPARVLADGLEPLQGSVLHAEPGAVYLW
jgi:hypothetical protein